MIHGFSTSVRPGLPMSRPHYLPMIPMEFISPETCRSGGGDERAAGHVLIYGMWIYLEI